MNDLLAAMAILVTEPWLALLPSGLFLLCAIITRSRAAFVVSAIWLFYCVYEYGMKYRILCSGECNIRLDLVAIYPFLIAASVVGVGAVVLKARRRPNA